MPAVVFVDARVPRAQLSFGDADSDLTIVELDASHNGLAQMAQALAGFSNLDAIHIFSHGAPGTLYLGDAMVTEANLAMYQPLLAQIGASLTAGGDILLYGCDVAFGDAGRAFIDAFAYYTAADVAASSDATGGASGTNWVLEQSTGIIEAANVVAAPAQQNYAATLATISGTANDDALTGTADDDIIEGLAGNDVLDGGAGDDAAVFGGASSGYVLGGNGAAITVTDTDAGNGDDGADALAGVESLMFTDGTIHIEAQGETRVNSATADAQSQPVTAALAGGGYVVAWQSYGQDGGGAGIYAQRYAANGVAAGDELRINTTVANEQEMPAITALADGGFVVTWQSWSQDGGGYGIYGQRYDAAGAAQGGEFQINATSANDQAEAAVTALADGGFVVTWMSGQQDGDGYGIYAQRFDAAGAAAGGEFQVNTTAAGDQLYPAVAALGNGGFVVTWQSWGQNGGVTGIYGQRFYADGTAADMEFQINVSANDFHCAPVVTGLADGGFVAVWQVMNPDMTAWDIHAQRFDAGGGRVNGEFTVNTSVWSDQSAPAVTALADGGYVVTWQSIDQDGSANGVYGQRYDAYGGAAGAEFRINTTIDDHQCTPSVSALADGGFVAAWQSLAQDGSGWNVYSQRFDAAGNAHTLKLTGDAGGSTIVWSSAADISLDGGGGNDTLAGGAGNDTLAGGAGDDRFVLARGDADGDVILDFSGVDAGGADILQFTGYGTAAEGSTFTQIDATTWSINAADGLTSDIITISNAANIDPGDVMFA
jgi:Domain of unknown function (DUF4347)/RTX calcium-binding nonapeptide repeat (4 copies)